MAVETLVSLRLRVVASRGYNVAHNHDVNRDSGKGSQSIIVVQFEHYEILCFSKTRRCRMERLGNLHGRYSGTNTFPGECPVELRNSSSSIIVHFSIVLGIGAVSSPGDSHMKEPGIRVFPVRLVNTLPTEAMVGVHEILVDPVKSSRVAPVPELLRGVMDIDVIHPILEHIVQLLCQPVQIPTQLLHQLWA